jgi:hypothetical protein
MDTRETIALTVTWNLLKALSTAARSIFLHAEFAASLWYACRTA